MPEMLGTEAAAGEISRAVLVRLAWTGLAVQAASLPISIAGMQIGAGLALGALVLLRASGVRVWVGSPLAAPVLALLAAALASSVIAALAGVGPLRGANLLAARGLALPLLVFLALEAGEPGEDVEAPRRRALALVVVWGVAALIPASIAWAQHRTGFDLLHALGLREAPRRAPIYTQLGPLGIPSGTFAAIGLFSGSTRLAHALTPLAALAAALAALAPLRRRTRVLLAMCAAAASWAVVLTTSRSAWAGLAVAAVVIAMSAGRAARIALPITVAASLAVGLAVPVLRERLERAFSFETNADRAAIWKVCTEVIGDHPVTGVGFSALPDVGRPYFARMPPEYPIHAWCHDSFLSAWAEGGPLLAGALVAWFGLLARGFLRWRREGDRLSRAAAAGALGSLAAIAVNALVHDVLWVTEPVYALGFLVGAAAVLARPRPPVSRATRELASPALTHVSDGAAPSGVSTCPAERSDRTLRRT
jgi:O-antigen ligase